MIFEVAVGERVRTVSVVRKGGVLHVDLDGHVHVVDARRVSDAVVSLLVQNGDGRGPTQSVDAAFATQQAAGDFDVHLAGRSIAVQVRPAGAFGRQKKAGAGVATTGPQRVTSPMPGKVVKVLVKAGDAVQARQGLVVVEAMKMENELRASREGRVREIAVTEGQSVDAGAVLMIVD
jgi:biotin carboxyl carrier protein